MEDIEVDRYSDAVDDANSKHRYLGFHIGMFQGLNALSISGMFVSVLYFGGYLVNNGSLSPSKLMNYLMSTQNTQRALATLVVLYGSVTKALGAGVRVFEYMDLPALVSVRGGRQLDHIDGEIVFHNIQFAYPSRPERIVLESFNLTVPKGKIVALVVCLFIRVFFILISLCTTGPIGRRQVHYRRPVGAILRASRWGDPARWPQAERPGPIVRVQTTDLSFFFFFPTKSIDG